MSPPRPWRARLRALPGAPAHAWLLLSVALATAALLGRTASDELAWQAATALTEPWRLWTAAFAHWSPQHLAANVAGVVAVAYLGWAAAVPTRATLAWVLAWPTTQGLLSLQPALTSYGGLSGVLHAGVAIASLWALLGADAVRAAGAADRSAARARRRQRWIAAGILGGLVLKVLLERPWSAVLTPIPAWDLHLAPFGHAAGVLAGAFWALVLLAGGRPRRAAPKLAP